MKLPIALVLALLLSGCVSAQPKASSGPTIATNATVDATRGGIEGKVVTDELQPLAGADVAVPTLTETVRTDPAGAFAFSNVAPGDHTVLATRIGYFQGTQKVSVKAGEVAKVQIVLAKVPVSDPAFDEVMKFAGHLTVPMTCEPRRSQGSDLEQTRGISWQEYKIPINASKPDGTELLAIRGKFELKSTPNAATVDVDMFLLDPTGKLIDQGTSGSPDELIDRMKVMAPGEYRLHVCFWAGAVSDYKITVTITYEQGERAKFLKANPKSITYPDG
jgi:hypothetical protein